MTARRDLTAFVLAVEALEPYLKDLVFVGGWAHYLYTLREVATSFPYHFGLNSLVFPGNIASMGGEHVRQKGATTKAEADANKPAPTRVEPAPTRRYDPDAFYLNYPSEEERARERRPGESVEDWSFRIGIGRG